MVPRGRTDRGADDPVFDEILARKVIYGLENERGQWVGGHKYGATSRLKIGRNTEFPQSWTETDIAEAFCQTLQHGVRDDNGTRIRITHTWKGIDLFLQFSCMTSRVENTVEFRPENGKGIVDVTVSTGGMMIDNYDWRGAVPIEFERLIDLILDALPTTARTSSVAVPIVCGYAESASVALSAAISEADAAHIRIPDDMLDDVYRLVQEKEAPYGGILDWCEAEFTAYRDKVKAA